MMRLFKPVGTALRALRRNVMRAVLTMLGIVIGVGAVIAMTEIGQGSSAAMQKTIATMGANNVLLFPGSARSQGVSSGAGTTMTMTPDDAEAIARECPAVRHVAPIVGARAQVVYGNRNYVPVYILGVTPAYLEVRYWTTLAEGDPFDDGDVRRGIRRRAHVSRRWQQWSGPGNLAGSARLRPRKHPHKPAKSRNKGGEKGPGKGGKS